MPPHPFRHPNDHGSGGMKLKPYLRGKKKKGIQSRQGGKSIIRAPKGSPPYLHKDELIPQRHSIWELLSKAQHDSAVWDASLVVVILLQLCKERTVGSCLPAFAMQVWDQAPCHRGKLRAQEKLLCCAEPPIGMHLPSDTKHQVIPP